MWRFGPAGAQLIWRHEGRKKTLTKLSVLGGSVDLGGKQQAARAGKKETCSEQSQETKGNQNSRTEDLHCRRAWTRIETKTVD